MQTFMPAASETGDPLLLTPGPLTTSAAVKQAMVHDWGSRDAGFTAIKDAYFNNTMNQAGALSGNASGSAGAGAKTN